jgi:hypothetical protein
MPLINRLKRTNAFGMIYYGMKKPVLRAGSEFNGSAVNDSAGMME